MADNSGTKKHSPVQGWFARIKHVAWWTAGSIVLAAVVGTWLDYPWNTMSRHPLSWSWLVPLGLSASVVVALVILWKGPQWQLERVNELDSKERFDRENEARKTLATILGGIVLLAGGFFTWQNYNLAQEGQITDRFTKAIEQLGATDASGEKKLEVRLGGIYALERIAAESERDRWPIMEVLTTYVRVNARVQQQEPAQHGQPSTESSRPAADVQAILTVLARRNTKYERSDFTAQYVVGGSVRRARFGQHLNLTKVDLRGADLFMANLSNADLSRADLSGADLTGANLSLADLSGAKLTDAIFAFAILGSTYNLTQEQIDEAKGTPATQLPQDLHMPESWKK